MHIPLNVQSVEESFLLGYGAASHPLVIGLNLWRRRKYLHLKSWKVIALRSAMIFLKHVATKISRIWTALLVERCEMHNDWGRKQVSQMKHQIDATLCRFYFCRVTLHVSGTSAHHQEYLKQVQRPLLHVLSLQVSHHISLLGPERP
jgi:hypothetical protein